MQSPSRYLFPGLLLVFAAACLYGLRRDIGMISLGPLLHAWDLVALAVVCSLLNYALRIVRWRRYLAKLGSPLPFDFLALTYIAGFAFTVSPGKVGEMARARYYSRFGISLPDVAGAFFVERLLDVMAMLVLATLIATTAPRYYPVMWTTGVAVVALLLVLTLAPWSRIAGAFDSPRLPHLVSRLAVGASKALGAARTLLGPRALLLGFVLGLGGWGLEGVGLYVLGGVFPAAHLAPAAGIGIYAVAVLAGAVSFLPGGLGSTEAVMTALLVTQGYRVSDALLVTIACRIVTLWLAVLLGWIAVWVLRQRTATAVSSWP
jgi:glycosyltransferase 2 family protein